MMDFLKFAKKRESCRGFQDKPVSEEDIMKIIEAGRLAPSGCNAQPWKFLVINEPEAREKMCDALVFENGLTGSPWRETVPLFIALVEQPAKVMKAVPKIYGTTQRFAAGDIAMASLNMCYEAQELGLGSCMLGLIDQKKMEQYFGIPEGHDVKVVLAIGYAPEGTKTRRKFRKPVEEICSFNKW